MGFYGGYEGGVGLVGGCEERGEGCVEGGGRFEEEGEDLRLGFGGEGWEGGRGGEGGRWEEHFCFCFVFVFVVVGLFLEGSGCVGLVGVTMVGGRSSGLDVWKIFRPGCMEDL